MATKTGANSLREFGSAQEIKDFIMKEKAGLLPKALSINDNNEVVLKSAIFENEEEIFKHWKVEKIAGEECLDKTFDSDIARNFFLKGEINADYLTKFSSKNTVEVKKDKNSTQHSLVISNFLYKARIKISKSDIKIKQEIQDEIEDILFGKIYQNCQRQEKKKHLFDFLKKYGISIPITVILGAKFNYVFMSKDEKVIEKLHIESKNHANFNIIKGDANLNMNNDLDSKFKDVEKKISSNGSPEHCETGKDWLSNLNKNYYDIIKIEESYEIFEFLKPELKTKVKQWLKEEEYQKAKAINLGKKCASCGMDPIIGDVWENLLKRRNNPDKYYCTTCKGDHFLAFKKINA